MKAAGVKELAISLTLLAASVYVLAQLDTGKLWGAIGAVTALATIMVVLAWAVGKMSDSSVSISKNGINIKGIKSTLIAIGIAVLLMAATVKIIGSMDPSEAKKGFLGLAGVVAGKVGQGEHGLLVERFEPEGDGDALHDVFLHVGQELYGLNA